MKKLYLHVVVAALMALPAGSALAAGEMDGLKGLYGGASFGRAEAEDLCDQQFGEFNSLASEPGVSFSNSCDDTQAGWKIFAGYQFTPNWGLEGAYVDLGKFSAANYYSASDGEFTASVTEKGQAEVDGFSLALTATAPYSENFAVFAKLGAYFWDLDETANAHYQVTEGGQQVYEELVYDGSISDDGTSLLLGIGAKYNFTPNFGVRAEWEWYQDVGKRETTGKSDINLLSIGLFASF